MCKCGRSRGGGGGGIRVVGFCFAFAWSMGAWSAWLCGREREIAIEVVCPFTKIGD